VAKKPRSFADFALDAARRGDPYPLIGRLNACLQGGEPLSDDEISFIVGALEATAGKLGADNLREIEQVLIAEQVEWLTNGGMPQKNAISEVMRQRGRSRRHVFNALKAHKAKS
jgi:hypothetical protein